MKPTCFSLLYVESDFGTTEPQTNHSQYSSPVEGLNLIAESKCQPVELENSTIGVTCAVEGKKSLQSYCSVDFDFLAVMRFDMTSDVTLRDDSSFINSQIRVIKNVSFSLLLVTFSIKTNF